MMKNWVMPVGTNGLLVPMDVRMRFARPRWVYDYADDARHAGADARVVTVQMSTTLGEM